MLTIKHERKWGFWGGYTVGKHERKLLVDLELEQLAVDVQRELNV